MIIKSPLRAQLLLKTLCEHVSVRVVRCVKQIGIVCWSAQDRTCLYEYLRVVGFPSNCQCQKRVDTQPLQDYTASFSTFVPSVFAVYNETVVSGGRRDLSEFMEHVDHRTLFAVFEDGANTMRKSKLHVSNTTLRRVAPCYVCSTMINTAESRIRRCGFCR